MAHEELPLFVLWEQILSDLLDRTMEFPKSVRFTFTTRIDNLALDIMENVVEARYTSGPQKSLILRELDMSLTKMRVLLRLCHKRAYLSHGGYEHVMRNLDEAGRMVGGWRKSQEGRG